MAKNAKSPQVIGALCPNECLSM